MSTTSHLLVKIHKSPELTLLRLPRQNGQDWDRTYLIQSGDENTHLFGILPVTQGLRNLPVVVTINTHGMATVGQDHLRAGFHTYSTFIVSLEISTRLFPLFGPLQTGNVEALSFLVLVLHQFWKIILQLLQQRINNICKNFKQK